MKELTNELELIVITDSLDPEELEEVLLQDQTDYARPVFAIAILISFVFDNASGDFFSPLTVILSILYLQWILQGID